MGLSASVMRLMIRLNKEQPFSGPVLTLGVQDVYGTYADVVKMYRDEKAAMTAVPAAEQQGSTSHLFKHEGRDKSGYVHASVFFRTLGIEGYDDVDFADFEKPSLIHDFNRAVPEAWNGKYGLVVDGGTTEHIFDVRSTLANVVNLLHVGGDVLHISPLSGWLNHGFYQLNPCLFYDFYSANGFEQSAAFLVQLPHNPRTHKDVVQPFTYSVSAFDLDDKAYRTLFIFRARKRQVTKLCIPTQGLYKPFAKAV